MNRSPTVSAPGVLPPLGVLHVVDSLEKGGLERLVHDLAVRQQAQGWRVAIFSLNATGGYKQDLEDAGIPVITGNKQRSFDWRVLGQVRSTVADLGIDVVHCHNFVPAYYAAAALVLKQHKPSLVISCHDMGTRLSNRRLRLFFEWAVGQSQRVAMVGKQVHEAFVSRGIVPAAKAATVLNGVPVARFFSTPERRQQARTTLQLSTNDLVVGCVGRLVELKNHQLAIGIWPTVMARFPQAKLVLIGDGPSRQVLQDQAQALGVSEGVVFAGLHHNVSDLLPALDVFAMPSLTEGISIALLEACATGLPVVVSKVGGNVEIVNDQHNGLLFESNDAAALLSHLLALLADAPRRQHMGGQAQAWVAAHASLDTVHASYERLYREGLAQARPRG